MLPLDYRQINGYEGHFIPSTLKINSYQLEFWKRSLLQRAFSVIEFHNVPDTWDMDYFKAVLFIVGHIGIFKTAKYGIIPQYCTLAGRFGIYMNPTHVNCVNQWISLTDQQIGRDCELIKLTPDYAGIMDIINRYAYKLSIQDGSIDQSIINTRSAFIFFPKTKAIAQSFKKFYDKICSGQSAVFVDADFKKDKISIHDGFMEYFNNNVGQNFITDKQLEVTRTLLNQFDTEIGIPNNPTPKKERQIVDEVNVNNAETVTRLTTWLDSLEMTVARVNRLFDMDIRVSMRDFNTGNEFPDGSAADPEPMGGVAQ